jgi:hypothetical protein
MRRARQSSKFFVGGDVPQAVIDHMGPKVERGSQPVRKLTAMILQLVTEMKRKHEYRSAVSGGWPEKKKSAK